MGNISLNFCGLGFGTQYEDFCSFHDVYENSWLDQIDHIYYINLEDRMDRRHHMIQMFNEYRFPLNKITRVNAVKHNIPFKGCTKSHLECLYHAKSKQYKSILVFEDDFQPLVDVSSFHEQINESTKEFDVHFLSMTPIRMFSRHGPQKNRVYQALGMSSYIVKEHYYDKLIDIFNEALRNDKPHDLLTQEYQKIDKWYGFIHPIAKQMPGFSDIERRYVDYTYLEVGHYMLKTNEL